MAITLEQRREYYRKTKARRREIANAYYHCNKERINAKQKAYFDEYCSRPEVIKRKSKYQSEYVARPEVKKRLVEYFHNPELMAKRRAYARLWYEKRKQLYGTRKKPTTNF